jgi:hypothetical protein
VEAERPHIVEAVDMIDMIMRVEHGIDLSDALPKELRPQIGRRVNEKVPIGQPDEHARPGADIARATLEADIATTADHRHPDTRARTEKEHPAGEIASTTPRWAGIPCGRIMQNGVHGHGEDY